MVEKVSVQRAPLVIERPAPARVVAARIEAPPPREVPSKSAVINRPMPTAVLRAATPAPLPQKAIAPPVVAAVAARPATRNPASTPPSKVLKVLKARDEGAGDHDVDYRAIRF